MVARPDGNVNRAGAPSCCAPGAPERSCLQRSFDILVCSGASQEQAPATHERRRSNRQGADIDTHRYSDRQVTEMTRARPLM